MSKTNRKQMSLPTPGPQFRIPDGESKDTEPEFLLLDSENLRPLERVDAELGKAAVKLIGQQSIQDKLYEIRSEDSLFDIESLAASIANNGFLKHERLVVAKYDGVERHRIVATPDVQKRMQAETATDPPSFCFGAMRLTDLLELRLSRARRKEDSWLQTK